MKCSSLPPHILAAVGHRSTFLAKHRLWSLLGPTYRSGLFLFRLNFRRPRNSKTDANYSATPHAPRVARRLFFVPLSPSLRLRLNNLRPRSCQGVVRWDRQVQVVVSASASARAPSRTHRWRSATKTSADGGFWRHPLVQMLEHVNKNRVITSPSEGWTPKRTVTPQ